MDIDKECADMLNKLGNLWEDGLREQLKVPEDWVRRSGYTSTESLETILAVIEPAELKWVSGHSRPTGVSRYGFFISPKGLENVAAFAKEQKNETRDL